MKEKVMTFSFMGILLSFMVISIVLPDKDVSYSERRTLSSFPEFNLEDVLSGDYMKDLDSYSIDHFLLRDEFRSIKANVMFNVLGSLDNNGIYAYDGGIYEMDNNLEEEQVISFYNKINDLYSKYFNNNNVYYSIIPDKNYYVDSNRLKYDYDKLFSIVEKNINKDITYIDVKDKLSLDDFYKTDTHYSQKYIFDLAKHIASNMNVNIELNNLKEYEYNPFYGVYYSRSALDFKADKLYYYSNDLIDSLKAYHYESDSYKPIYDISKLGGMDSYDVYLSGASSIIEIDNPYSTTKKELILFRDSFGSSIAPLLLEGYSKITLVDIRYVNMSLVDELIDINNQDVLFLYSTLIVNNSNILKTN